MPVEVFDLLGPINKKKIILDKNFNEFQSPFESLYQIN